MTSFGGGSFSVIHAVYNGSIWLASSLKALLHSATILIHCANRVISNPRSIKVFETTFRGNRLNIPIPNLSFNIHYCFLFSNYLLNSFHSEGFSSRKAFNPSSFWYTKLKTCSFATVAKPRLRPLDGAARFLTSVSNVEYCVYIAAIIYLCLMSLIISTAWLPRVKRKRSWNLSVSVQLRPESLSRPAWDNTSWLLGLILYASTSVSEPESLYLARAGNFAATLSNIDFPCLLCDL
jgi:hypothetical protein